MVSGLTGEIVSAQLQMNPDALVPPLERAAFFSDSIPAQPRGSIAIFRSDCFAFFLATLHTRFYTQSSNRDWKKSDASWTSFLCFMFSLRLFAASRQPVH